MFKKVLLFFFLIFISTYKVLIADDKINIIEKLKNTNSFKFNFKQEINENTETGICYILFSGLLKCNYNDNKKKELIINKNRLAITQKRYNKTYHYPISKSPFLKILNKTDLIEFIKKSDLSYEANKIVLSNLNSNEQVIKIFFETRTYNLVGWELEDQFKKKISFSINILSINEKIKKSYFLIPKIN